MEPQTNGRGRRGPTPYQQWQEGEGIPINRGSYVEDLHTLEVAPWARTGQRGAFVNLADQEDDDAYVLEIAPGGQTEVFHHLFEATAYVLDGRGATTFWQEGGPKHTVEWQRGSMFSPPLNCSYQHFNLDGHAPARLFAVSNAPMIMNLFRNPTFVFNDHYVFEDRYDGRPDYFTDPGQRISHREWQTNFVPDLRSFQLVDNPGRGVGNARMGFALSNNQMAAHMSQFPPGTYKHAHWHGVGAYVIILGGQGYSLLWFEGEERRKVDWKEGTVLSPREREYHQHFNTGPGPARYLALRLGNLDPRHTRMVAKLTEDGEDASFYSGIPYDQEDPAIHELYVQECAKNGATVVMPPPRSATAGRAG
jgi:quercetin dioxygenase-like cupin family protein